MKKILLVAIVGIIFSPLVVSAAQSRDDQSQFRILSTDGESQTVVYPFDASYRGGGSIASADLGGDGVDEIVLGAGPGLAPLVSLYRQDGSMIASFYAYAESFTGGVNVALGDVDDDGEIEIITGAMFGGGPHVRVFDSYGNLESEFFAYDSSFRGGVNVAAGDVNNDGVAEVITGAGITGGPHVKVFTSSGEMLTEIFTASSIENTGAVVATADVNGDGDDEIITGRAGYSDTRVQLFDWKDDALMYVLAIDAFEDNHYGVNVFGGDIDGDGMEEIGVGTKGGESKIVFYEMTGRKALELEPFNTMSSASASVIVNSDPVIVTIGSEQTTVDEEGQYILVDIDRQTIFAYQDGALQNSFLISGGTSYYPSPTGDYEVMEKILWKDYTWYFGDADSRNYDLSGVKYNLKFKNMYYIHSAYWHNNFGNPMSHGCINTSYEDAEWIYEWADVGATVEVR
ncbi:L,D-transpeptidase family protein [Candidatus Uhrbacteria bacterium]|jgi:lipoprotein-anchoring transpeptidase ErfK/SrfK|nr:L,D-transpeptidase family protein [Candidatus Uhrbacteria bacterium]MBT7716809.1 L,D-transpeptidase family protein [Candidatus Uhrbacteria bacterium]